jgi:hypothetical protein
LYDLVSGARAEEYDMGRQVRFSVEARSAASPPAVYTLLSDGATWPGLSPFDQGTIIG